MDKRALLPISGLLLLLLPFALADPSGPLQVGEKDTSLIHALCNYTTYYDLCVLRLEYDPRSTNANAQELDRIAVELAITTGERVQINIDQLYKNSNGSVLKQTLHECSRLYGYAIADLRKAISSLNNKDYDRVYMFSGSARFRAARCENKFPLNDLKSPLTRLNRVMDMMCDIAGDIARNLISF